MFVINFLLLHSHIIIIVAGLSGSLIILTCCVELSTYSVYLEMNNYYTLF